SSRTTGCMGPGAGSWTAPSSPSPATGGGRTATLDLARTSAATSLSWRTRRTAPTTTPHLGARGQQRRPAAVHRQLHLRPEGALAAPSVAVHGPNARASPPAGGEALISIAGSPGDLGPRVAAGQRDQGRRRVSRAARARLALADPA